MGQPDQFLKQRLELDTSAATGARVVFECAPEIRTDHLTPDGLLARVRGAGSLDDLPDPWPRLEWVAVLENKSEKDHHDALALARAELRRHACWVRFLDPSADEPASRRRRRPTTDAATAPETTRSFFARPPGALDRGERAAASPRAGAVSVGPERAGAGGVRGVVGAGAGCRARGAGATVAPARRGTDAKGLQGPDC